MIPAVALDVPWLAAATTAHLAFAALCNHKHQGSRLVSPLALVSLALAGAPWAFPTLAGIAGGLLAHSAWFAVCSRLAAPVAVQAAAKAAPTRPAPSARLPRAARAGDVKPKGFVQTPILSVIPESDDIKTFRLARPEGFDFTPGQFLTLRIRADGKEASKAITLGVLANESGPARDIVILNAAAALYVSGVCASLWDGVAAARDAIAGGAARRKLDQLVAFTQALPKAP